LVNDRTELIKQELPMAAKIAKQYKTQGKTFLPSDFGFFRKYSAPEVQIH